MALALPQQLLAMIERAKRPLIVLPENAGVDEFTSALALSTLLAKLEKPLELATTGGRLPKALEFLKATLPVRGDLPNIRRLTLTVNAKDAKVDELSYEMVGDELKIHLLPKTGHWKVEDVKINVDSYRYDLVLAVGAPDLSSLGALHKQYADFFFAVPVVNIDHRAENEYYGALNAVEPTCVAVSEVIYDLFQKIDPKLLDETVATYLLTGMIGKTQSFKSRNVSPKTLKVAAELVSLGARRDEIVEHLFKTRSVETLKLWGRALSRLKANPETGLVWTMLTREDFSLSGATPEVLGSLMEELMMTSPDAKVAAVFYEHAVEDVRGMIRARHPHDALLIGSPFRAMGTREECTLQFPNLTLVEAEKQLIKRVL